MKKYILLVLALGVIAFGSIYFLTRGPLPQATPAPDVKAAAESPATIEEKRKINARERFVQASTECTKEAKTRHPQSDSRTKGMYTQAFADFFNACMKEKGHDRPVIPAAHPDATQ